MGTLYRRVERGNWQAEYTDHAGRRIQKSTRLKDKKTAAKILAYWETEEAKRASGLIDVAAERIGTQSARPISEHKIEWIAALRSGGRSTVHVDRCESRLQAIIDHTGWQTLRAITPESVESFVESLRGLNRSNQTVSHYLQSVTQFTRWLTRTGRISANPLLTIQKPNPKADRRRNRRMLLPAEWPWLAAAAGSRAIIYETAIQTGLRSGEIRSLHPSHVHATAKPPYVTVRSDFTKDSKLARQYVTTRFARQLAKHKPHTRKTFFGLPDEYGMADMLRGDLQRARENWLAASNKHDKETDFLLPVNDADELLDFHALRHTCGAWLAIQGVHAKTIQTVMRHKTITLTMDTYGHLFPDAEPEAIQRLDGFLRQ